MKSDRILLVEMDVREWLSGRASPCQGEGREFESRLALLILTNCIMDMREWLSGRASPCQGEGREFESRLALEEGRF